MGLLVEMAEYFQDCVLADLRRDQEKKLGQEIPDDVWFDWVYEVTGLRPTESGDGQH